MKSVNKISNTNLKKISNFTHLKHIRFISIIVLIALISATAYSTTSIAESVKEFLFGNSSAAAFLANSNPKGSGSSKLSGFSAELTSNSLNAVRQGHTATQLDNGKVLIAGGDDAGTAEIFDLDSETSLVTGSLSVSRTGHTATLLKDGRVLITGGFNNGKALAATEIYDNGVFVAGPNLNSARAGHTATVLADGRILILGGDAKGSVEILDATAQSSQRIKTRLNTPRSFHSAELLKSGELLIIGGLILNAFANL